MMREALKQGGRAAAHDGKLYLNSWGFDVTDIETPTYLWYGARDETVPAGVGEWLADQIPDTTLEVWPETGHFTWMNTPQAAEAIATTSGIKASPPTGD